MYINGNDIELDQPLPIMGDSDYDEQIYITSVLADPKPALHEGLIDDLEFLATIDEAQGLDRVVRWHRYLSSKLDLGA